jgi:hypothetical protein
MGEAALRQMPVAPCSSRRLPPRGSRWTNHAAARGASARPAGGPQGAPRRVRTAHHHDRGPQVRRRDRRSPACFRSRATRSGCEPCGVDARGRSLAGLPPTSRSASSTAACAGCSRASPFPPAVAQIPLAALFAPSERPAATVTPSISQSPCETGPRSARVLGARSECAREPVQGAETRTTANHHLHSLTRRRPSRGGGREPPRRRGTADGDARRLLDQRGGPGGPGAHR